jgi:hypothetical protein
MVCFGRGDQLAEPDLVSDVREDLPQPDLVAAVRRRCDAIDPAVRVALQRPIDDAAVAVGDGVMRLVDQMYLSGRGALLGSGRAGDR